ncbi:MAG: hypothetical protein ACTH58_09640 [Marinomonas foliarum]|uniref:hypothetical protein n=1 Tax=Marinomonas foliarum TaxID=491950 RepID=UPI003F94F9E3
MDYFTYITGIATLIGFVLQIFDALPTYRSHRQKAFYLLLGLFLGSLVTAFDGSKIIFSFEITGLALLVSMIGTIIFWSLYVAMKSHREEFFAVSGVGTFVLIVVLAFGTISPPSNERARLTISELSQLSEISLTQGNYERAIKHQEAVLSKLKKNDVRYTAVKEKIEKIKLFQVDGI